MRSTVLNTRTESRRRRPWHQSGQAIVLIALLMLVLMGMLGLAIDSGRAYVDRRNLQAAVDAAALAAGDWHENFNDLTGVTLPQSKSVFQKNVPIYSAAVSDIDTTTSVGPTGALRQDTDVVTYQSGMTLTVVATNTQFNGYQFTYTAVDYMPLAFMQIFGGSPTTTITATATAIVGNQRQQPALLTLSSGSCAMNLKGGASLTVLGDVYSNGTACVDANLHEAGNCYGAGGSTCSSALYYCYNATPGFVPYPPPCLAGSGDIVGQPVVPAPTLPDPGYTAPSWPYYNATSGFQMDRGSYTEMTPGTYSSFALTGCSGCYFLDSRVYTWNGGYSSHGGLVSNELKSPHQELWSAPRPARPPGQPPAPPPFSPPRRCDG